MGRIRDSWLTAQELDYINTVDTRDLATVEQVFQRKITPLELLENYVKAIERRTNWTGINENVVKTAALKKLTELRNQQLAFNA